MEKVCDECSMQFKDNEELGTHLRQNHKKLYCGACKKEFESEEEFKNHIKSVHGLSSNTSRLKMIMNDESESTTATS